MDFSHYLDRNLFSTRLEAENFPNIKRDLSKLSLNLTYRTGSRDNRAYKIQIFKIDNLIWPQLQALLFPKVYTGKYHAKTLLFLYFTQIFTADEIGFRGLLSNKKFIPTEAEKNELHKYAKIFYNNNFTTYYQTNMYIEKNNLWKDFQSIGRTYMFEEQTIKCITPEYAIKLGGAPYDYSPQRAEKIQKLEEQAQRAQDAIIE